MGDQNFVGASQKPGLDCNLIGPKTVKPLWTPLDLFLLVCGYHLCLTMCVISETYVREEFHHAQGSRWLNFSG